MTVSSRPILVSGSLCLELAVTRQRIRHSGPEERVYWQHGGTGGHMAVTAARLGAAVALCAQAGRTTHDDDIIATLVGEGIDVSGVVRRSPHRAPTHLHADVPRDAQPVTVSSPVGPALQADDVDRFDPLLLERSWLLADLALPAVFLDELIDRAALYGLSIIICAVYAGNEHLPRRAWDQVDYLVSNVTTVEHLARRGLWPVEACAEPHLLCRARHGMRGAIVLNGAEELRWANRTASHRLPLAPPHIVHVRGAGAVAAGATAAALAEQQALSEAVQLVRETVAFYISHEGTRAAMPLRRELSHHVSR